MPINNLNRKTKMGVEDKAIAGLGCLIVLFNIAWIALLVWAIIRLVLHFT